MMILLLSPSSVLSQSIKIPVSPEHPTYSDCARLSSAYWKLIRPFHKQRYECYKQTPKYGFGKICNGEIKRVAWVQCNSLSSQICLLRHAENKEQRKCSRRAQLRAFQEENTRTAQRAVREENIRQKLASSNQATSALQETTLFINSPVRYLRKVLRPKPHLFRQVFNPNKDGFDAGFAEELYRLTHQVAWTGSYSFNRVPGAINKEALLYLKQHFVETISEMEVLMVQIDEFSFGDDRSLKSYPQNLRSENHIPANDSCKFLGTC
ncbi:MAG: hypothetical protein ACRBC3_07095 [Burkholderiaceae bacterium]